MTIASARARTKTIATVGPACRDEAMLTALMQEGVDIFRINMAHGDRSEHDATVTAIRSAAEKIGYIVGILVDLAGPKIRLGTLRQDPLDCEVGTSFRWVRGDSPTSDDELTSNYPPLVDELSVGDEVFLADGTVAMEVTEVGNDFAKCVVVEGGPVRSRQGINLPGAKISAPALTESDLDNAQWAAKVGADFVGLSFVRSETEIGQLKQLLQQHGSSALVLAKIEKREALDRLEQIVAATDGVMVARGDLGVEIDVAEIAVAQKRIINVCSRLRRPVIVATQMLDSMHHSRRPTRAEATDVANAVLDGADACMLSGETAIGQYPREAVATMNRILHAVEETLHGSTTEAPSEAASEVHPVTSAVVYGAGQIARQLPAKLVVIATRSGATARIKAKQRNFIPTIGVSDSPETLRCMTLLWGITPLAGAPVNNGPNLRSYIEKWGLADGILQPGDFVVYVTGSDVIARAHNLVVVQEVEST